ncbi:deoxynucleoside triphosphate triphosphohydrolase SAMHD1 [Schistocerca americana]|nr:deoxynucleoside triphosphate triphosphohydrolase SAMHD1 [Schistocerca americana]XP_046993680.1 deoxynucleoside triphosphate triphosphohydrolase SAMHD1 [Schistocerca americana]XP_046993681.1 deoxynucleoside triphosphate triphosphohydrolase SAMHD1 [Schistocerca americana]XP_046993682.1 deoxynucleoside triphosphate triphosphohydrolase SAMHD1 [Schistocerca americana]XP_046993683.1 deoxynucleoside triphosphate triphosphohydrolase SAMHD1 [Schistocerca americana]XP_046993684.1 deoxynucleoside trip
MPKIPNGIPGKVFHDCVHGSMWLHPLCVKLVDTLEFQRLRNIKQLGLAYLVYPGAGHNRFEHSLGVCYLASRMLEALEQNSTNTSNERLVTEEEALCVQIAGLCHDLGHGPFSHTWEHFVSDYDPSWKHETSTLEIFDELANRFDEDFKMFGLDSPKKKLIKELIKGEPLNEGEPMSLSADKYFIYEIISNKTNDIDVDKWEYLARDAAQLGVPVAFQSKRLFEFCRVGFVEGDERAHIIIRDKEAITVFAMFQARSELHYFAYQHRVVLSLEEMLLDAFREADRVGYTHNGYKLSEIHKDARAFVTLNDSIFYNLLYSHDEYLETSRRLLADICERKIYEFVCLKHITPAEVAERMQSIRNQTKDESEIQRLLLKSFVSNAKEMIRKTGLLTDAQVESLIYKKIEMKVRHAPERDALDTVYVYSKYTPEKGTALRNWKNVPIYPIDVEKLCHVDILILTRTKLSDTVLKKLRELSDHRVF